MLYEIVKEICEGKSGRVYPVLATELELKRELSRRGVKYTSESFRQMCLELSNDSRITTIRTLNHYAYADNTKEYEEVISAEARGAGQTNTYEHTLLPKPAVAQGKEPVSTAISAVCGVPEDGEDNPSDGGRSHHADKYWWSEI